MDICTFRKKLLEGLYVDRDEFETYHLTENEWKSVHELKDKKYSQWDWNFGKSPKFNIQRERRFDIGEIDLRLDVAEGYIKNLKIYRDFLEISRLPSWKITSMGLDTTDSLFFKC